MSQDNCALNQDGLLKDASEIQWFNDVDDETPLSQPGPSKTNLKPSKTKRARLASFLDLEAEVASGSEDEDPIDSDDDFINNFTDDKDNNIDRPRLSLTQAVEAEHGFIDHLTNKYVEKSRRHGIAHSSITPQDWPMFDIPVKEGSEEIIVHMLTTQAGPKHIRSTFASAMIPGHVYVEGHNLEDVKKSMLCDNNELRSFEKCRQIPADVMELSRRASLSSNIKIGDQVKIMLEGGKEYLAFVEDIEGENASLNLVEFPMQVFSQSLELLQKFFKVGDGVRVKSGEHKGRVGMVTTMECNGKIGDKTITFLNRLITCEFDSSDLDHCNEVQRSTTFRWPDGKSDSPVNSAASYGSEAYQMRVDPYRYQYGKYAWLSNVVQLEVPECLMFSKDLVECPMKDLYIPGYSDKSMNDFFTAETTGKDTKPALGFVRHHAGNMILGLGLKHPLGIQAQ
ncbi:hypothetical protein BDQ17DRAFT_1436859 [Cyathus striatus]|nr:hypothetical protein BDQ17DRAFT_1436859 [Cyathus striatus]